MRNPGRHRFRFTALFLFAAAFRLSVLSPAATSAEKWSGPPRRLILALDGVPYQMMRDLQSHGYFSGFHPTSRMVSSFPSMTDVAFSEMFAMAPPLGYQRIHFSRERGKVVGGLGDELLKPATFEYGFHAAHTSKIHGALLYVSSSLIARHEIGSFRREFQKSDSTADFFAYMHATDAIAHRHGPKALRKLLVKIDRELNRMRKKCREKTGRDLEIVLVSDHGNTLRKGRLFPLKKELLNRGYRPSRKLQTTADAVAVANGIVSYVPLATMPEAAADMARDLAQIEGVNAALFHVPAHESAGPNDRVRVVNLSGEARLIFDADTNSGRYEAISGAPLNYLPVMEQAQTAGLADAVGNVPQGSLFKLTLDHAFPDAIRRGHQCFHGGVQRPASVVISLQPGHEFANSLVKFLGTLNSRYGTHGGLGADDTLGVYMRTDRASDDINTRMFRDEVDLAAFQENVKKKSPANRARTRLGRRGS